jgi:hypothetical protein
MNPNNFLEIWETLKPLMITGSYDNLEIKQKLLDLVVLKDNIGEAFWYLYTSILNKKKLRKYRKNTGFFFSKYVFSVKVRPPKVMLTKINNTAIPPT